VRTSISGGKFLIAAKFAKSRKKIGQKEHILLHEKKYKLQKAQIVEIGN